MSEYTPNHLNERKMDDRVVAAKFGEMVENYPTNTAPGSGVDIALPMDKSVEAISKELGYTPSPDSAAILGAAALARTGYMAEREHPIDENPYDGKTIEQYAKDHGVELGSHESAGKIKALNEGEQKKLYRA